MDIEISVKSRKVKSTGHCSGCSCGHTGQVIPAESREGE